MDDAPSWGIEPVPERLRVLGLLDTTLLWVNLGISLLVLVAASYFDLSLRDAVLATVLGGLIGNTMLGVAAMIGADARVPTMVLQRAPLGQRGSYLATGLNVLQCLGWAVFELIVIATAAGALSDRVFGFEATWAWKLVFGALATGMALLGPIGFVRRFVRKIGIWAVVASVLYLGWWILDHARRAGALERGGARGLVLARDRPRHRAHRLVDPARRRLHALLDDAARRVPRAPAPATCSPRCSSSASARSSCSRTRPSAARPTCWSRSRRAAWRACWRCSPSPWTRRTRRSRTSTRPPSPARTCSPRVPQRPLIVTVSVLATVGALAFDLTQYQQFLLLLGAFFVPLFGVLLADWLLAGAHYRPDDVFRGPAFRPGMIGAWLAGFLVYEWLAQTQGLGFWSDLLARLHPPESSIGASLPGFAVAFGLAAATSFVARRWRRPVSATA